MDKSGKGKSRFYLNRNFIWVVALFVILASGLVVMVNFSVNLISASRNYTALLSQWSQFHTQGSLFMERYGRTGDRKYHEQYLQAEEYEENIAGLIDELFQPDPDAERIFNTFDSSELYPNEITTLIFAFDYFGDIRPIQRIHESWDALQELDAREEALVDSLLAIPGTNFGPDGQAAEFVSELNRINRQWMWQSRQLSGEVAAVSQGIRHFGLWFSVIIGILLFLIGIVVSVRVSKSISRWDQAMGALRESLREKETLLGEVHHRVKNNLAVISGLLELESLMGRDNGQALSESRDRIKSMAIIHEILYRSNSLSNINLRHYMEELTDYIGSTYLHNGRSGIRVERDFEDVMLNINQAIPIGLVLNEILANSIEHGFDPGDSGEIRVALRERDCRIYLTVSDDGKGLGEDFDLEKAETVGFTIVRELLQQLDAKMEVENGEGARFTIHFEKTEARGAASSLLQEGEGDGEDGGAEECEPGEKTGGNRHGN